MKLKQIQFNTPPAFPGLPLRGGQRIETDNPLEAMRGFRCIVRGSSVYFVSPPGWRAGDTAVKFVDGAHRCGDDPGAPRVAFEIPRADLDLMWGFEPGEDPVSSIAEFAKSGRHETEPFDKPRIPAQDQTKSLLSQVPD